MGTMDKYDEALLELDEIHCEIASACGWDMHGETFIEAIRRCIKPLPYLAPSAERLEDLITDSWCLTLVEDRVKELEFELRMALQGTPMYQCHVCEKVIDGPAPTDVHLCFSCLCGEGDGRCLLY